MNNWNQENNYYQMHNMMGMPPMGGPPMGGPPMGGPPMGGPPMGGLPMGGPQGPRSNKPPLLPPPQYLLPEMNMPINPAPPVSGPPLPGPPGNGPPLIGPMLPDNMNSVDMTMDSDEEGNAKQGRKPQDKADEKGDKDKDSKQPGGPRDRSRDNRRDRNRNEAGRNRNDSRGQRDQHDRNRQDRNNRNRDRNDRSRERDSGRREKRSKWSNDNSQDNEGVMMPGMPGMPVNMPGMPGNMPGMAPNMPGMPGNMPGMAPNMPGMSGNMPGMPGMQGPMPGQMMPPMPPYGNMNEMGMNQQQMEMPMQNMGNMANMGNMGNMGMNNMGNVPPNMMPGMNMMMPNMMNPNMMMNQQPMIMPNQPLYVNGAVLLPPTPGTTMPARREKPLGCRTIFVGGLPPGVGRSVIEEIFQNFGMIVDIKLHRGGVCHVRFNNMESVEKAFLVSGFRFKTNDMTENEATTLFVDYALNREDQSEYEKNQRQRGKTPPRVEPFSPTALETVTTKIKSEDKFSEAAPTLISWLERGECNKKNANSFYSLIQASNNQVRRLYNDKMALDEEYQNMKISFRERFASIVTQFEQVAKILSAAKQQRVSDHFTKLQRRNIDMWLKMTEELENVKEEFNANFDDEEIEKAGNRVVLAEKYEQLKNEYDNLMYELEGYKNEAFLAKDEAERKFEKFKAHFIASQALQQKQSSSVFPPLPPPPPLPNNTATVAPLNNNKPQPPPPTPDDEKVIIEGPRVPASEAKLISILTAFLMVHPLGASLDYLVSYVRSMSPTVTTATVNSILQKYNDVFVRKTTGIGANIEHRWSFVTFDAIKEGSYNKDHGPVKFQIGESKRA